MGRGRLERLFTRYQRRGDLAALAEVFDRTAGDLLRLAHHLSRDPLDAEDLLQDTFVTAIERASSWDAGRPLLPWLTGILARKASSLRRRETRPLEAERLSRSSEEDPYAAALTRELSSEVSRALQSFDAHERALLLPYLRGERAPIELARELGLAPGTVRMRIHRGLERLRQLLPAGVGAGVLGIATAPRGLAAIRRAVLAHASHLPLAPTAASLSTGTTLGFTLAMTKTTTLLSSIAGALILAGALYWTHGSPALVATSPGVDPVSHEGASVAGALDPTYEVPAALAAPTSQDGASGERSAILSRSLRIQGRVLGVDPEQLDGVRVSIVRSPIDWSQVSTEESCLRNDPAASCRSCHEQDSSEIFVTTLSRIYASRAGEPVVTGPEGEPQVDDVGVDEEGRFSVDLTSSFADEDAILPQAFAITADHDCYFAAQTVLVFPEMDRQRFRDREHVVLSTELTLAPAAVVRGTVLERSSEVTTADPVQLTFNDLDTKVLLLDGANSGETAEVSFQFALSGELNSGVFELQMLPMIGNFYHSRSISVALFPVENGEPLPAPIAQTTVNRGEQFEIEIAEEGPFVLVAFEEGSRPRTFRVNMRLREIVEIEAFALEVGASLQGRLVSAEDDSSDAWVVARRREASGDRPIEFPGQDLVWSRGAIEWRSVTGSVDEEGGFRIAGLAPDFYGLAPSMSSEIDLASAAAAEASTGAACLAPSSGIVLAPDHARIEVQLARHGAVLEELPPREAVVVEGDSEDGTTQPPPPILLRMRMLDSNTTGEFAFEDRTRALVLVEPSHRLRCELWVGEDLRDSIEMLAPPAGAHDRVLLELGDL